MSITVSTSNAFTLLVVKTGVICVASSVNVAILECSTQIYGYCSLREQQSTIFEEQNITGDAAFILCYHYS
jgi:hypothetical protein